MPSIQIDERLITFLIFLPLFFISLAVHEFAHAFFAFKLGDDTAKNEGRLTLNPIKHVDILGSVIVPVMAFASGFAIIGWAKPVPVDRRKFKNPLMDDAKVSAAGPFSNLILSFIFFLAMALLLGFNAGGQYRRWFLMSSGLQYISTCFYLHLTCYRYRRLTAHIFCSISFLTNTRQNI
ncbi:MAG TPA: site-2 protease family protein [Ignavibacteriaceae bacterium]|nr:site-2 protease family protein [Ignavibacteriaceae bacterium]